MSKYGIVLKVTTNNGNTISFVTLSIGDSMNVDHALEMDKGVINKHVARVELFSIGQIQEAKIV